MWRIQGFVGRVLHRCHVSAPLRLPQNHHVEDEVLNSSGVLSTSRHSSDNSSQNEQDGEARKQRTFQFNYTELPPYTVLDAVGLGAATFLVLQMCRRIHSQFSTATEPGPTSEPLIPRSSLHRCGYRILLEILSRKDVLPMGKSVFCLPGLPERLDRDLTEAPRRGNSGASPQNSSKDQTTHSSSSDHQRSLLNQDSALSVSFPLQNDGSAETKDANHRQYILSDKEQLAEATQNLKHVGDSSVSVVLNVIGLENVSSENQEEAFACFLAAAQRGYSKAQFNVGVCYEKGRGVQKNTEKALFYYRQAAGSGHTEAQYRYAKLLLTSRGHHSLEELKTAIELLEQASVAGLTKAQLCLASVYAQKPVRDANKSVHYLQMAAEDGDDRALLLLGQCHENGFGVEQNLTSAMEFYKQAARAGNKQAERLLMPPNGTEIKVEDVMLRSISSAPCFSVSSRHVQQPISLATQVFSSTRLPSTTNTTCSTGLPPLPHSWSSGSLCVPYASSSTPLHLHPRGSEGQSCQWTVGVG